MAMASTTTLSSLLFHPSKASSTSPTFSLYKHKPFLSLSRNCKPNSETDASLIGTENPDFPTSTPRPYIPRVDDTLPSEEEIARSYEQLYGPAYSGVSVLGNDVYATAPKVEQVYQISKDRKIKDQFEERVVQVRRVTKVVKGGKQLHFRAVIVVGDKAGQVGVGVGKAKEVLSAVLKAAVNARRNVVVVPMTKHMTFPHRAEADYGAARVMLRPAAPGTGVIAGGSVRIVLEMAGLENALGKQLGSDNALNNARATVAAVMKMRHFSDVARERGIPIEQLWK